MDLHYHTDYTRSVVATIGSDTTPFHLLPDTAMSQIIVLREGCSGCYSLGDNHKFSPKCENPSMNMTIETPIQWFYQIHVYETNVTGKHHEEKFCIPSKGESNRCGSFHIVASEKNQPRALFLRGNGFFGLGVQETVVDGERMKMSALDQMYDKGLISEKKFGVHVKFNNHTEVSEDYEPTTIRFGDYDKTAFDETHEIMYMNTVSSDSWELPVQSINFHGDDLIGKPTKALINPGMPFIAAPLDEFDLFKENLKAAHPDANLVCTRYDWCYFIGQCSDLEQVVDPLTFVFGDSQSNTTFSIPSSSFMIPDVDYRTNLTLCHLGIVGQKWSESYDVWRLGETFMQNFYTAFDATNPNQL